jgi:predicted DNA-binding transcriptional regulator AlpA
MIRLLTANDLEVMLGCSLSMVYNLAKDELKPDVMLFGENSNRGMRWNQESIDLFIAKRSMKQEEIPDFVPLKFVETKRKKVA